MTQVDVEHLTREALLQQLQLVLHEDMSSVLDREQTAFDRLMQTFSGRIVLFGAGKLGRRAIMCLRGAGIEPLALCDNNQQLWGGEVDGLKVLPPATAAEEFGVSSVFAVTVWSDGHKYSETTARLKSLGCVCVVPSSLIRWRFPDQLLPDYSQGLSHHVYEQASDVARAALLWSDSLSRIEYLAHVTWRATGDPTTLPSPDRQEESYFPSSIFSLSPEEVFIDCGAYDGDTIKFLLERQGSSFRKIVTLEPDPGNFQKLQDYLTSLPPAIREKIVVMNLAAGSQRGTVKFAPTGDEMACIRTDGALTVECAPLDELIHRPPPTYIKLDIEGAELEALAGAKTTIRKARPILAVCVYHKQADLWQIPLYIQSICPDYHFFLRDYQDEGWQLVSYAVPPERVKPSNIEH